MTFVRLYVTHTPRKNAVIASLEDLLNEKISRTIKEVLISRTCSSGPMTEIRNLVALCVFSHALSTGTINCPGPKPNFKSNLPFNSL